MTGLRRSDWLPDLPAVDSVYPGFDIDNGCAMFAPPATPVAIVELPVTGRSRGLFRSTREPTPHRRDVNFAGCVRPFSGPIPIADHGALSIQDLIPRALRNLPRPAHGGV